MKQKIPFSQVSQANGTKAPQLPKYSSSVINSASGYAHATDPKNVGMVSQEIQEFCNDTTTEHNLEDWKTWHLKHHENGAGINRAIDQAWEKFQTMRESLNAVTRENVAEWMEDFVYNKTYDGLMVQKAVIKAIADKLEYVGGWQMLKRNIKASMGLSTINLFKLKLILTNKQAKNIMKLQHALLCFITKKIKALFSITKKTGLNNG